MIQRAKAALAIVTFTSLFLLSVVYLIAQEQLEIHAPYLGTPSPVVDAMLKLAGTKKGDVVYDLGCGDGRIVIAAAKRYRCRGIGIDINPERVREAQANAQREGVAELVSFRTDDVNSADFRDATVVMLYLLPDINLRLRPKLQCELKPGARIVSHSFNMGDWKPKQTQTIAQEKIFLWTVPKWSWPLLPHASPCSGRS
jgi:SAM-dependent methyltransferase